MRKLPLSLQISAAVHALVITWAISQVPDRPPSRPPAPRVELIDPAREEVDIVPVEVRFLDPAVTAALPETAPGAIAMDPDAPDPRDRSDARERPARLDASRPDRVEVATGTGTGSGSGTGTEPGTGTSSGTRTPLMDMRKGAPVRLTVGVPTGRWDGRDRAPETFGPDIDSGKLRPDGGGTYRSDEGPFTAKVDRDGSVRLKDKKNFHIRFALPGPKTFGRMVADWYTDPNKPVGTLAPEKITRAPVLSNEEATGHRDPKPDHGDVSTIAILSGGFDITDALMRRHGQDPYASRKLAYLDSTRDHRVQIGQRHRQQQLEQAAVIMKANLDRVWSLPTPAARREALFELWDECAETGPEQLVTAGREARKLVVGVIRSRLPVGSADAFTAAEIAALNRTKQSKAMFAPYD